MQPTALVTGAGSGIGRAVTLALLAEGYRVALAGRGLPALAETARQSGASASNVLLAPTDVTKAGDVDALFAAISARFGRLDLLFNNAGAAAPAVSIDELSPEQWNAVVS